MNWEFSLLVTIGVIIFACFGNSVVFYITFAVMDFGVCVCSVAIEESVICVMWIRVLHMCICSITFALCGIIISVVANSIWEVGMMHLASVTVITGFLHVGLSVAAVNKMLAISAPESICSAEVVVFFSSVVFFTSSTTGDWAVWNLALRYAGARTCGEGMASATGGSAAREIAVHASGAGKIGSAVLDVRKTSLILAVKLAPTPEVRRS